LSVTVDTTERSRIIEAAYHCLTESHGSGVSVSNILAEAGLSTRAFYRHFDSKDALLLAMFRRDSERVIGELQADTDTAGTPAEALCRWIEGFLRLTTDARRRRRVLVMSSEELMRTTGYVAERGRMTASHRAVIADILRRGRADGSFPSADPEADSRIIMAALVEAFQEQMAAGTPASAAAAAAQVTDFVFRALGACPAALAERFASMNS
jgi:AcrR family transcriptional regulator